MNHAGDGPVCPEARAGLLSTLTFSWLSPLIKHGYTTPLTEKDLWVLPPSDRCGDGGGLHAVRSLPARCIG
jgi:hypothetical protein